MDPYFTNGNGYNSTYNNNANNYEPANLNTYEHSY